MKQNLWKLILCVAASGTVCLHAPAAGLQRADVIADPAWLLHLDCDGLRPTVIGQYILSEMDKPAAQARLASFQTIFGFDLRNHVHGVTLYGGSQTPADGVLMIYADFDPDHLVALAKAAKEYQGTTHNGHVIHSWIDVDSKRRPGAARRVYAAIQDHRVILGQRQDRVAQALDVIDDKSPSLSAGGAFPGLGAPGNVHFIEGAARKLDATNSAPNAAILRLSKNVQLVVGESQKEFQGAVTLVADSDEAAGQIYSITQGLVAVMKLQSNNPDAVRLANAVVITQNGSNIQGRLVLPAADLVAIMQAEAARMAAARTAKPMPAPAVDTNQQQ